MPCAPPEPPRALCPRCGTDALYRYGKTRTGKERFLCLLCGRQFSLGNPRLAPPRRPACPRCGKPMHIYKREKSALRFRCPDYPACSTFLKLSTEAGV